MELVEVFADDGNRARRRGESRWPLARALPSAVVAPVEEDLDALAVDADEHLVRVDLAAERGDAEDVVGHGALDRRCRAIPELISSDFK